MSPTHSQTYDMSHDLQQRIVQRLLTDYEFKENGDMLQQGRCPRCEKRELFTSRSAPWALKCGRENKCGEVFKVKELYPNEFQSFNKRFIATPKQPNATADAYLQYERGFDISRIRGWYEQGKYWHPNADKGTATVRFWIDKANDVYMERFVERVNITNEDGTVSTRRANFKRPHRGLWWQMVSIEDGDTVWITEGILNAIALYLNGIKAVAILSCGNFPRKSLEPYLSKKITWVWALDNDRAGQRYTLKHLEQCKFLNIEARAAQIPAKQKSDWNDLHIAKRINSDAIKEFYYHGDLLTASSAIQKAILIWRHNHYSGFVFDYAQRLYWFDLNTDKYTKARERILEAMAERKERADEEEVREQAAQASGSLVQIANVRTEFLYFQRNEVTDESWFYCRVHFPDYRPSMNLAFTPSQMTTAGEFKKRLVNAQGAWFKGDTKHLDWMGERWLHNLKVVETIDYLGYSARHGCYVFPSLAIKSGQVYEVNEEDYFDLPRLSIKSLFKAKGFKISNDRLNYRSDWPQLLWHAFGAKGLVAAVFWYGSLFAEQIRELQSSFPFLEIIGEAGAGKTTLIEILWRLFGQDKEGIDPNKGTFAGLDRTLAQFSNMPTVFIEADRDDDASSSHRRRFDWEETKPYYNGRGMRVRGQKNNTNETHEQPFRGTLAIAQNEAVNASDAVMQRIVHLSFTRAGHSEESKQAIDTLNTLTIDQLSFFLRLACANETNALNQFKQRVRKYELALKEIPQLRLQNRLNLNHAQLMVLCDSFAELVNLNSVQLEATKNLLIDLALERKQAIGRDHKIVENFWEVFNYVNTQAKDGQPLLDHSADPKFIAVNLPHFVEMASMFKQQIPLLIDLKRHLKSSKSHKYIEQKVVPSAIKKTESGAAKSVRCWVFQNPTENN